MSDLMLEKLSEVSLATVVVIVILICILVQFLVPILKKVKNAIIKKYKKDKREQSLEEMIHVHEDKIKEYADNRIHDREQSFAIQKQLVDSINKLNKRLDDLNTIQEQRYQESIERENKRVRAELKDRIGQSYRYHASIGEWNHMEKESLEDLIEEYESAGGTNSFVHDVVVRDMYSWTLLDTGYTPKHAPHVDA